ncbi:MAG: serine protease AprX [Actinomycetota bacterium]|jgi:serine protease AprX|nr:serine protease AprX [Actinomycetota bacterium]
MRDGVTWDVLAPAPASPAAWRRNVGVLAVAAALATTTAVAGVTALHGSRSLTPVQVGANPWFASLWSTPTSTTPLPDLASVEKVVGAQTAWASGANGKGIDVALIDSGVVPVSGLNGPNKLVIGPDLSFDGQNPDLAGLDSYGHGTAMAGIIAGNDGTPGGFMGVAPQARIVSVKVGAANGAVDVSQVIAGIDWVVQHAHDDGLNIRVMNISLGTSSPQRYQLDPLAHAAENAWRHGIVVVASVGNNGTGVASVADPANDPFVIAVGSSDPRGTVSIGDDSASTFSSKGSSTRHADVLAPGAYIVGLRAPGSYLDQQFPGARIGDRYFRGSGTSQAAAVVSGALADILSARPTLTPDGAKKVLLRTAQSVSGSSDVTGNGQIQIVPALTDTGGGDPAQTFTRSTGTGTLEGARGDSHVAIGGVTLTGEQDIFGNPWNAAQIATAEEAGATWSGGTFNGATWSGATWSGATWSGATWSGATWSGATWSGATWSGATWSGATWSSVTWSGATWSGATWSGATWSGATWSGATWSGATWSGAGWT